MLIERHTVLHCVFGITMQSSLHNVTPLNFAVLSLFQYLSSSLPIGQQFAK